MGLCRWGGWVECNVTNPAVVAPTGVPNLIVRNFLVMCVGCGQNNLKAGAIMGDLDLSIAM